MENGIKTIIEVADMLIESSKADLLVSSTSFSDGMERGKIIAYTIMRNELKDLLLLCKKPDEQEKTL